MARAEAEDGAGAVLWELSQTFGSGPSPGGWCPSGLEALAGPSPDSGHGPLRGWLCFGIVLPLRDSQKRWLEGWMECDSEEHVQNDSVFYKHLQQNGEKAA